VYSRHEARRLQQEFARRHLKWFAVVAVLTLAVLVPSQWLTHRDVRVQWFTNGVIVSFVVASLWQWTVVASGSASLLMGDMGEQWTQQEVRSLPAGWKVIHHLELRKHGDIDTVLLGPPGLVVLETKWSARSWTDDFMRDRIDRAATYVADVTKLVKNVLRPRTGELPFHSAVVLWPGRREVARVDTRGVAVFEGTELREWLATLPDAGVSTQQIAAGWAELEAHIGRRDEHNLLVQGAPPQSAEAYLSLLYQASGGFVLGLLSGFTAMRLGLPLRALVDWLVGLAAVAVVGLGWFVSRRIDALRTLFTAGLVGWTGSVSFMISGTVLLVVQAALEST
jgi:hypothetical protein